uniref:HAT C-terminal dimerisation domain-containing protein n=1 Tax=Amphimedon queenslandica TaxID=400682 RepID=A0A1X7VNW7_AMPQE
MPPFETNKTFILGAILDPCFKLQWCADDNKKQSSITLLKGEVAKVTRTQEQVQPPQPLEEPPPKKTKQLFTFMPEINTCDASHLSSSEVEKYLESQREIMETNPLDYWKANQLKYPAMAIVAKQVLAVPASSAAVERLFSIAGKVFTPEHCRLTEKRFTELMFIRLFMLN